MAQLFNQSKGLKLLENLKVATHFFSRIKGLIGCKKLDRGFGLWFMDCNWIHTFFMSMTIDVIYLDKNMKVRKLQKNLKPWKLPAPVFGARSVIETQAGFIDKSQIEIGDVLHVGN